MSQLLEFKIKPFEAIHFRQNARLISSDSLVIEKQKALARKAVFVNAPNGGIGASLQYRNKVHHAFSSAAPQNEHQKLLQEAALPEAPVVPQVKTASGSCASSEHQAAYVQQRGQMEVRVASGDVTYVPAIEMTIITSWPGVDFTYTGGFHYAPPVDHASDQGHMIINTHYYGSVEYTEEELVTFPEGLFGFSDLKQYLPLGLDDGDGSLLLLQSIENPDIAFFLINPPAILPDYCPALQPEELDFLQVSSSDELSYYSICVVRSNYLENTVNLKCPLAINPSTRRGMQIILSGNQYGYRHPLGDLLGNVDQEGDIGYADSETQKK